MRAAAEGLVLRFLNSFEGNASRIALDAWTLLGAFTTQRQMGRRKVFLLGRPETRATAVPIFSVPGLFHVTASQVYSGSDGSETRRLLTALRKRGLVGDIDEAADMAIALRHMPLPLKAGDSSTFGRVRVDVEADHWLENATKPGVHSV